MYNSTLFFISIAAIAFIADIDIFFTNHQQFIYLILHLYIFELLNAQHSYRLAMLAFLLALESFMFYGVIWAPFILITPLTMVEMKFRHHFYRSWGYALGVGALFFLGQILVIEPFLLGIPLQPGYTFFKLCANILIVGIISLKTLIKANETIARH